MSGLGKKLQQDERGLVAIVITLMMLIIISVIVLSFSQTARREQRAQLDRQLSARAFYAAESGVNLARNRLADPNHAYDALRQTGKNTCPADGTVFTGDDYKIDGDDTTATAVTCLTVDPAPTELHFDNIGEQSTIFPMHTGATNTGFIKFTWNAKNDALINACPAALPAVAARFPAEGAWTCGQSLLRVDLVNLGTTNQVDRASLPAHTGVYFLYPTKNGTGAVNFDDGSGQNQGKIVEAHCTNISATDSECTATINVTSPATGASPNYAARVISLYKDAALSMEADDSGGVKLPIQGAQAVIDSTAKAQDVLRRVRVNVPLYGSSPVPDWALASGQGICKQYAVDATGVVNRSGDVRCDIN